MTDCKYLYGSDNSDTAFLLQKIFPFLNSNKKRQQNLSDGTNSDNDKESSLSRNTPSDLDLLFNLLLRKTMILKILLIPNTAILTKFKY